MSGISSTLKDEIKKTKDERHKDKFKFISTILLSNIMVAMLCLPMGKHEEVKSLSLKTIHPEHQIMLIPLDALVSEEAIKNAETPVSLITKENKIVSRKAYLHGTSKKENDLNYFKVEIKNADLKIVAQAMKEELIAIPFVENITSPIPSTIKKGSKYEVNF